MTTFEKMKSAQQNGCCICPRCGRENIKTPVHTNALSRVADIYVCDDCGSDEALRAFAGIPLPVDEWFMARIGGAK